LIVAKVLLRPQPVQILLDRDAPYNNAGGTLESVGDALPVQAKPEAAPFCFPGALMIVAPMTIPPG